MRHISSIMWPVSCGHASCGQHHVITHHVASIMWSLIIWPESCAHASHVPSIMWPASCWVQSMQQSTRRAQTQFLPVLCGGPAWAVSQSDVCPSTFNLIPSHLREPLELTLLVIPRDRTRSAPKLWHTHMFPTQDLQVLSVVSLHRKVNLVSQALGASSQEHSGRTNGFKM